MGGFTSDPLSNGTFLSEQRSPFPTASWPRLWVHGRSMESGFGAGMARLAVPSRRRRCTGLSKSSPFGSAGIVAALVNTIDTATNAVSPMNTSATTIPAAVSASPIESVASHVMEIPCRLPMPATCDPRFPRRAKSGRERLKPDDLSARAAERQ
jgi:hypothetical protein